MAVSWLYLTSVNINDGDVTVSVSGGHDLSAVEAGWSFDLGTVRAEISSGTAADTDGNSTLTLATAWSGGNVEGQEALVVPTSGALIKALNALNHTNDYAIATHDVIDEFVTEDKDITLTGKTGEVHTFSSLPKIIRLVSEAQNAIANNSTELQENLSINIATQLSEFSEGAALLQQSFSTDAAAQLSGFVTDADALKLAFTTETDALKQGFSTDTATQLSGFTTDGDALKLAFTTETDALKQGFSADAAAQLSGFVTDGDAQKLAFTAETDTLKQSFSADAAAQLSGFVTDGDALTLAFTTETDALKQGFSTDTATQLSGFTTDADALKLAFTTETDALKQGFSTDTATQLSGFTTDTDALKLAFTTETDALKQGFSTDFATQLASFVEEANTLKQSLSDDVSAQITLLDTVSETLKAEFEEKTSSLTISASLGYRNAVEKASGGRETVIVDAQGNENLMCVIPRMNYEDLGLPQLNLGTGTMLAFQTNGVARSEVLISKYINSTPSGGSGFASIGGAIPRSSIDFDTAKALCVAKGTGWHMISQHEWELLKFISKAHGHTIRGGTDYGRAHDALFENATRADGIASGDISGDARTKTGQGPLSWSHDGTPYGVMDLTGNLWEWVDQFKIVDGRVYCTDDNNADLAEASWIARDVYYDTLIGLRLNDSQTSYYTSSSVNPASSIGESETYVQSELMRRIGLEHAASSVNGYLVLNISGERIPLRGGTWFSRTRAGPGALYLARSRNNTLNSIGSRSAFFA